MAIMMWNNQFATGIASIDKQHQQLVGYVNDLYDAMTQNKGDAVTRKVLNDRRLHGHPLRPRGAALPQDGYPETSAHIAEHDALKKQVGTSKK